DPVALRFRHVGRDDGLSQAYVNDIAQDRQGVVWFATQEGLNRFDGYRFRVYTHDASDRSSLGADLIRSLAVAGDGTLWVGTDGGGVASYDSTTDSFVRFQHQPERVDSLSDDRVRVIGVAPDGVVWAGTDASGLNRIDSATGSVTRFDLAPSAGVYALAFAPDGGIWAGGTRGLFRIDPNEPGASESITLLPDTQVPTIRALWLDRDGTLWIGTAERGVIRRDASGATAVISGNSDDANQLSDATVNAIRRLSDGTLWVGTENGLDLVDGESLQVTSYAKTVGQVYGLRDNNIQSIFEDEAGLLWVGTFRGASYSDMLTAAMERHTAKPDVSSALATNNINGFAEDSFGRIWVATRDRGVIVFDEQEQSFSLLEDVVPSRLLAEQFVTTIRADQRGEIWVGTRRSGLFRVQLRDGTVTAFRHSDAADSISGDAISAIYESDDGRLWIAAFDSGLNRFDAATETFERIVHSPDDNSSPSSNRILVIAPGRNESLWLGHWRFGVDRLNTRTGVVERVTKGTELANTLVQFLQEDSRGDLWIGTASDGLFRWSAEDQASDTRRFEKYTERSGLPSSTIYSGVADRRDNFWLGTGNGLTRLDTDAKTFENYDTSHGLLSNEFTFGAAFRSREGKLYFGGDAGFNTFFPEQIRGNAHPPKLAITAIRKQNQPLSLAALVSGIESLELTHRDYLLEFEVAALDYAAPERNQYRFRLDGLDEDWIDVGEKRSITYTNLEPGRYTFRAQAANNYGVWSRVEATLPFVVQPAPWATWLAYCIYALALLGIASIVYRAQTAKVREQAAARHAADLAGMNRELTREVGVRRQKERALEQEKRRAETYFNVAEVVLLTLDASLQIVRVNDKGSEILGLSVAKLAGRFWLDFVPAERREVVSETLRARLLQNTNEQLPDIELPMIGDDGQERLFVWNTAVLNFQGEEPALFLSGMDVTRMRALEKQIRLREKMNAIGTLAGGIAHDFNNILQAIYGFTTLALDNLAEDDQKATYLKQVVKGADRARNLVKRILTFSNQKEYDLQAVDIGPVIKEACALLRGSLPATVEIDLRVDEASQAVRADPTRIHQIVMNLGTNGAQAMGERGGKLSVSLTDEQVTDAREHGPAKLRPGDYVVLRVHDTGVGMTPRTLEHIFDPFFTTKDTTESTGLGLTVVHGIVQSHGGEVFVQSEPGKGTEFSVYLPGTRLGAVDNRIADMAQWRGTESVALVDDEVWVLTVTRKILEAQGYRVVSFSSGADALAHFEKHASRFDILITDETMPKMTGSQLIKHAHEIRSDLPTIIISGKLAPAAVNDPNTWFLQKPFTAPEINEKVRFVLDEVRRDKRTA
ncbi:MAG: two-component regulator propeller domain-containing protein, partial [Pseudomonadota bacterium]